MAETNPNLKPTTEAAAEQPAGKPGGDAVGKRRGKRTADICEPADLGALTYVAVIQQSMGERGASSSAFYKSAWEQMARMRPRDAMEELLISQMLVTHARILFLGRSAGTQTNLKWSELMHAAADRAVNTFRRQMETLAEYRQPRRRRRSSFTTIRTAHINAKQILTQPKQPALQPDRAETQTQKMGYTGPQKAITGADPAD